MSPRMTFTAGNDALASQVNTYLMDQAVMTFASATARNSAISSPTEGMLTYLSDINQYQTYTGSEWAACGGVMPQAVFNAGTQNFGTGSESAITTWTNSSYAGMSALADYFTTASGVINLVKAGKYRIVANVIWATNATGQRGTSIYLAGATYGRAVAPAYTGTGQTLIGYTVDVFQAAAADTVAVQCVQSSGATLAITTSSKIWITYLGA